MPDAAWAGFRVPPDWSQRQGQPPVLTSPNPLSTLHLRMFTKVATVFTNAATAEQSCKALSLRLSGTPPRGAVYPTGV